MLVLNVGKHKLATLVLVWCTHVPPTLQVWPLRSSGTVLSVRILSHPGEVILK